VQALIAALEQAGASVTSMPAYELVELDGGGGAPRDAELELLATGTVDAVCVGSAAEVRGLSRALAALGLSGGDAPLLAAAGGEAAEAAELAGLEVGVTVDERGGGRGDLLVAALTAHFGAGKLLF